MQGEEEDVPQQPRLLMLIPGKDITAEKVAALYKFLTGKDATPEELERTRARLENFRARFARPSGTA
jgi:hypothetical protein